jgi:hypothetical protein
MIAKEIQIPKFSPDIYSRIALNDLVTFAVYFLSQHGREINAEDIRVSSVEPYSLFRFGSIREAETVRGKV